MLFYDDWFLFNDIDTLELNDEVYVELINQQPLADIVKRVSDITTSVVGDNPAFCLSGGIDSQAAYQLLNCNKQVIIFRFAHDLNSEEVTDAINFAQLHNINYKIITLDVLRFLNYDLIPFAKKYKLSSPQFAVHCFFLEEIRKMKYTGAIFGGNGLVLEPNLVHFVQTKAQLLDLEYYSRSNSFPIISNYLSFNKELGIKLAISTPIIYDERDYPKIENPYVPLGNKTVTLQARYNTKIFSYKNLGLSIIPQPEKRTGFEQLKTYVGKLNFDGYAFEKFYREPLYKLHSNFNIKTVIPQLVIDNILHYSVLNTEKSSSM